MQIVAKKLAEIICKMVQNQIYQVDIAFLSYNPTLSANAPSVTQDEPCTVGLRMLQKHREHKRREKGTMGTEAYHHYKWYNSMLVHDIREISDNAQLKIVHWHIESGNTDAFMMAGLLYTAVSIIIGPEYEHWYCSNRDKEDSHSYGSRDRRRRPEDELTEKMAHFTINDDEATFVVQPVDSLTKCTAEVCANNCMDCKKLRSPFTKSNTLSKCVCFPSTSDFQSLDESDLDADSESEDQDIAHLPSTYFGRKGKFLSRFKLNVIREEPTIN